MSSLFPPAQGSVFNPNLFVQYTGTQGGGEKVVKAKSQWGFPLCCGTLWLPFSHFIILFL